MNPIRGASSSPTVAGGEAASNDLCADSSWDGLAHASGQFGVDLDGIAQERIARYGKLLLQYNTRFNLTAIRDPVGVEQRLFLDALAMVPTLDRVTAQQSIAGGSVLHLIDVGAGAGFPGLPLKIARPDLDVTLVDATAKKVAFLKHVIAELSLDDTQAIHGRAEALGQDVAFREGFELATARAVAGLPILLEYVIPFLRVGGTALLPKGLEINEELRAGNRAAARLGAEIVCAARLPVGATRLVVATKDKPTPASFPRRTGIPSRSPLGEGS